MKIRSSKNRIIVYDLVNDSVSMQGNVCNGMFSLIWGADSLHFSNTRVAHCTSLVKYLTTERGYSDYGIHVNYKLLWLEKNNSNAESEIVVLHSKDEVADNEIYPRKLVTS